MPFALLKLVSFPLQLIVTKIATILISLISIPVYREGNILFLSQTSLEVVDACSGIRSIVALTMLSVLLAFFEKKSWVERVILILSALPIAFVANVFRVTITGILAHFLEMSLPGVLCMICQAILSLLLVLYFLVWSVLC